MGGTAYCIGTCEGFIQFAFGETNATEAYYTYPYSYTIKFRVNNDITSDLVVNIDNSIFNYGQTTKMYDINIWPGRQFGLGMFCNGYSINDVVDKQYNIQIVDCSINKSILPFTFDYKKSLTFTKY